MHRQGHTRTDYQNESMINDTQRDKDNSDKSKTPSKSNSTTSHVKLTLIKFYPHLNFITTACVLSIVLIIASILLSTESFLM